MPNHITTEIVGPQQALACLLDDAGNVDFNYLIPEPPNLETGGCSGEHAPGVICWYSWHIENWGTKWNAYDYTVEPGKLRFDTAWSHPMPVMRALAAKYPDEKFEIKYADEDIGSNLAHYVIQGDSIIGFPIDDRDEFATQLKYGTSYADYLAD